jgi:hypothetical protein
MKTGLAAAITKITTMRDRTIRLQVDLQETAPENMAEMFALNDTQGWFFFHESPIKQINLKDLPALDLEPHQKSPSQRLHSVLYLLHKQNGGKDDTFDPFYKQQMERFIEAVKEKLT